MEVRILSGVPKNVKGDNSTTIIAYKDGILAADTLVCNTDTYEKLYYAEKIFKSDDGWLIGANGDCTYCLNFIKWAQEGRVGLAPKQGKYDGGLLISPQGKIRIFSGQHYEEILNPFVTIGSGSPWAMAVMEIGGTAIDAVNAAMKWCMTCGGEITVVSLANVEYNK